MYLFIYFVYTVQMHGDPWLSRIVSFAWLLKTKLGHREDIQPKNTKTYHLLLNLNLIEKRG